MRILFVICVLLLVVSGRGDYEEITEEDCTNHHGLYFMRLPRTGTKVWDRYLKAYEILYDSVTLFTEDGGCTFNFLPWEEDTSFKSVDCETSVILPDCEAHLHLLHLEQTFEPYWQHRELESTIHSFHFDDKAAEHKFSDGEATIFRGGQYPSSLHIHDMTVLREPAEWYFSLFQHRRELEGKVPHEAHPDAIFRRAAGLDITEVEFDVYLDNTYWMWNIFTRSLAGDIDHDTSSAAASFLEPRNSPSKDHVIDALVEGIERRQTDISDEALAKNTRLDAAVRRLKSFTYFALFDRVKESLALFDFTFCVDTSRHRAFKNVKFKLELTAQQKHDRPQLEFKDAMAKSKKLVDDVLRMDQLLYKKAVEIFDERMQRMKDLKAKGMECSLYNSKCGISCESNGHT